MKPLPQLKDKSVEEILTVLQADTNLLRNIAVCIHALRVLYNMVAAASVWVSYLSTTSSAVAETLVDAGESELKE